MTSKTKKCNFCGKSKIYADFAVKRGKPSSKCKACHNEWYKRYYAENSESIKRNVKRYKQKYVTQWTRHGLTKEEFEVLKEQHGGKCWICKEKAAVAIDHDHNHCPGKTGCSKCVRGVLCNSCNVMLGSAKDNIEILQAAIDYLS